MTLHPDTSQGVSVAEAAATLGVSTTTIRRMIKRGQLEARTVLRPQGRAFLVSLPATLGDAAGVDHDTRQAARATSRTDAAPLAAWSETFLAPLVAVIERQAEQLVTLARENGELRAENAALLARGATDTPKSSPGQSAVWWRSWAVYGALGLLAVVVPVLAWVLLGLPR